MVEDQPRAIASLIKFAKLRAESPDDTNASGDTHQAIAGLLDALLADPPTSADRQAVLFMLARTCNAYYEVGSKSSDHNRKVCILAFLLTRSYRLVRGFLRSLVLMCTSCY